MSALRTCLVSACDDSVHAVAGDAMRPLCGLRRAVHDLGSHGLVAVDCGVCVAEAGALGRTVGRALAWQAPGSDEGLLEQLNAKIIELNEELKQIGGWVREGSLRAAIRTGVEREIVAVVERIQELKDELGIRPEIPGVGSAYGRITDYNTGTVSGSSFHRRFELRTSRRSGWRWLPGGNRQRTK